MRTLLVLAAIFGLMVLSRALSGADSSTMTNSLIDPSAMSEDWDTSLP